MIGNTSPAAHTLPLTSPESFAPRANDDPSRTTPTSNNLHNPAGPDFNQNEKKVDESSTTYMPPKTINY